MLTNLSANHLDRYESVAEYYGDKALLFRNANARSHWVTNADDADGAGDDAARRRNAPAASRWRGRSDAFFDRETGMLTVLGQPLIHRDQLSLLGDHNVANALAAALAVMVADRESHRTARSIELISRGLSSFSALEHRIEPVGEFDGVTWINDSKSTNVASTLVAMRGMTKPTVLLLGGRHKGEPYTALVPEIARTGRAVVAYGEAASRIEHDLSDVVPVTRLGSSFDEVVAEGRRLARRGDAVLLSPACSSYDMFDNYEQRGAAFKRLALANVRHVWDGRSQPR